MQSAYLDITKIKQLVETEYQRSLQAHDLGLLPVEAHVIALLAEYGALSASELARHCGRLPTSFTGVLDRLEEWNYIARMPHATDGRSVCINLSPQGAGLVEPIHAALSAAHVAVCAAFVTPGTLYRKFATTYAPEDKEQPY